MDALYGTRPATSAAQTVQCPEGYVSYVIRAGDTLRSIAQAHGITVTELLFYNPELNPYGYRAGDRICVPGNTAEPDENQPDPSVPGESMPDEGTPDESTPGDSAPDEGMPGESAPSENTPSQPGGLGPVGTPTP